jgi:hypothetical protein
VAHQGQPRDAEEGVVHVSHVVRPVADAAIILILQQPSSAAARRQI